MAIDVCNNVSDLSIVPNLNEIQQIYDEYSGEEDKILFSSYIEFCNNKPIYDNYESNTLMGSDRGSVELISITTTKNWEEHNFTLASIDLCSYEPFFDEYEYDVGEIDEGNQHIIQDVVVNCHKINDICTLFLVEQVEYN